MCACADPILLEVISGNGALYTAAVAGLNAVQPSIRAAERTEKAKKTSIMCTTYWGGGNVMNLNLDSKMKEKPFIPVYE